MCVSAFLIQKWVGAFRTGGSPPGGGGRQVNPGERPHPVRLPRRFAPHPHRCASADRWNVEPLGGRCAGLAVRVAFVPHNQDQRSTGGVRVRRSTELGSTRSGSTKVGPGVQQRLEVYRPGVQSTLLSGTAVCWTKNSALIPRSKHQPSGLW